MSEAKAYLLTDDDKQTIKEALYHGQWHRTYKQAGRRGRIYNVRKLDYHR